MLSHVTESDNSNSMRVYPAETDQLAQVVLDPGQVGERTDGHQATQSKVKQLVAEKRDEPAVTMLSKSETGGRKLLSNGKYTI